MNKTRIGRIVGTAATTVILTSASLMTSGAANASTGATVTKLLKALQPQIARLGKKQADEFATGSQDVLRSADAKAGGDYNKFLRIVRGACTVDSLQNNALTAQDILRSELPLQYEQEAASAQSWEYRYWRTYDENAHQYVEIICDEVKRHPRL